MGYIHFVYLFDSFINSIYLYNIDDKFDLYENKMQGAA